MEGNLVSSLSFSIQWTRFFFHIYLFFSSKNGKEDPILHSEICHRLKLLEKRVLTQCNWPVINHGVLSKLTSNQFLPVNVSVESTCPLRDLHNVSMLILVLCELHASQNSIDILLFSLKFIASAPRTSCTKFLMWLNSSDKHVDNA